MIPATRVHVAPSGAVPTLTEVVDMATFVGELPMAMPMLSLPAPSVPALGLVGSGQTPQEATAETVYFSAEDQRSLTQNVLRTIQKEVDTVLDQRLKDALVPILARCAESMMQALREDLASTLHEVVAGAVAVELNRASRN